MKIDLDFGVTVKRSEFVFAFLPALVVSGDLNGKEKIEITFLWLIFMASASYDYAGKNHACRVLMYIAAILLVFSIVTSFLLIGFVIGQYIYHALHHAAPVLVIV